MKLTLLIVTLTPQDNAKLGHNRQFYCLPCDFRTFCGLCAATLRILLTMSSYHMTSFHHLHCTHVRPKSGQLASRALAKMRMLPRRLSNMILLRIGQFHHQKTPPYRGNRRIQELFRQTCKWLQNSHPLVLGVKAAPMPFHLSIC